MACAARVPAGCETFDWRECSGAVSSPSVGCNGAASYALVAGRTTRVGSENPNAVAQMPICAIVSSNSLRNIHSSLMAPASSSTARANTARVNGMSLPTCGRKEVGHLLFNKLE